MPDRRRLLQALPILPFALQFASLRGIAETLERTQTGEGTPVDPNQPPFSPQMFGSPVGDRLPGQPWKVHDRRRPQPRKVTPGLPIPQQRPSSDATVLFDGKSLSQWQTMARDGSLSEAKWKVENGYVEMVPRTGSLITKESFGDCQLHLEWMTPTGTPPERVGQMRGNSGVILMKRYEIQVLSSYDNVTYADGAAGGIYGLYPPLVNPCMPEGEWNTYDIVFKAPIFKANAVVKPATLTLFFNGLVVHDHVDLLGSTDKLPIATYEPHPAEEPFLLQGHAGPARYRNIWIRRLKGYDS